MNYLPSITKVKALTTIRRERVLPQPGEVVVRPGQDVSPVQVVARASAEKGFQILRASRMLGVLPEELPAYLLVEEGSAVQRGMPIMQGKPNLLGRRKRYASPVDGVLFQVRNGYIILQHTPELVEMRALMQSRVASIVSTRGVILETSGSLIQAMWDSGKEAYGKLKVIAESPDELLKSDGIGSDFHGTIVVVGRIENRELLQQIEDSGARGVIAGSLPADLCQAARSLSYPVFLTDGIGYQPMADMIFHLLQQSEDRELTLFMGTPGLHGSRSEIVIPLPTTQVSEQPSSPGASVEIGQRVRVLRYGTGSPMGTVVAIYSHPRLTAIGTRVPGADVELQNGELVFVPYTNLDLII
ncbi:MAG: hypothetical protein WAM60_14170 [Candidatus Promineifilaceae bacterium]